MEIKKSRYMIGEIKRPEGNTLAGLDFYYKQIWLSTSPHQTRG